MAEPRVIRNFGTLTWKNNSLAFKGEAYPKLDELTKTSTAQATSLAGKLGTIPAAAREELGASIKAIEGMNQDTARKIFEEVMLKGNTGAADMASEPAKAATAKIVGFLDAHAKEEFAAFTQSQAAIKEEIAAIAAGKQKLVDAAKQNPKNIVGYAKRERKAIRAALAVESNKIAEMPKAYDTVAKMVADATWTAKPAPAADAMVRAEVDIGKLEISSTLRFEGGSAGPEAKEALGRMFAKARELETAIKKSTGFNAAKNDIAQSFGKESPAIERVIEGVLQGKLDSLHDASLPAGAKDKIEALFTGHAKAEYEAFKTEFAKSDPIFKAGQKKLLEARLKHLGEIKLENIPGYDSSNPKATEDLVNGLKASVESEMKGLETASAATTRALTGGSSASAKKSGKKAKDSAEKEEGFWTKLVDRAKRNLGKEAWEERATETGFRAGGVVVGLGAVIDAIVRSNTKDDSGAEVSRSAAVRASEGIIGAVLAGGSAFIGGRK
jgi:hypothetical protein